MQNPSSSITEQGIERVDLELRDSNLITGTSSHDLCLGYMVQPQWNLTRSLRETSKYSPFIHRFTEHIFLHARRVLDIGDRAINKAALAHKEFTPHARVYTYAGMRTRGINKE